MSLLSQVKKGKIQLPALVIVYGVDGVGKSTFAASAPSPIFVGTEKGTASLDVARFPTPKSFKEVLTAIDELTKEKHDYKTLAIDSLDWLEPLVWEQVCIDNSWKSIEDPGYGKGYVFANKYWQDMMSRLSRLREDRGMNIVLIAHSQVKLAKDPQAQAEYDRYQLKLNDKAAALWREFVDSVLFANFEVYTKSDKSGKTKAYGEGARLVFTERRPGFDAKNRMGLPSQLPLSWDDFKAACDEGHAESAEAISAHIQELLTQVQDAALKDKITKLAEEAKDDASKLERIQNKLRTMVAA
jgi:hypothetical protein